MAPKNKQIRDYTPGKNDFLNFANAMNKNAALDFKQVAPNTVPTAAPTAPTTELEVTKIADVNNSLKDNANTINGGEVTSTPTAEPADVSGWEKYKADNGVLGEGDWYAAQGLDPDRDYQDAVNTLNYGYQTAMSTYGENAEKMYQMGLTGSGVSDVFQANAFSTYLSNMNDAAAARIAAKKQNKALYNAYLSDEKGKYNQELKELNAQKETKIQSALEYVNTQLNAGYTDYNALTEQVKSIYGLTDADLTRVSGVIETAATQAQEAKFNEALNDVRSLFTSESGEWLYVGNEYQKQYALNTFKDKYGEDVINEVFARIEADKKTEMEALTTDIVNIAPGELRLDQAGIDDLKVMLENTAGNTEATAKLQNKVAGELNSALASEEGLKSGYNVAGVTEDEWNAMSDAEKVTAILNKSSQLYKEGIITSEQWGAIAADHITTTMDSAREEKKKSEWFDEKNDNRYSFAILETAADLALFYKEKRDEGLISEEEYKAACVKIYDQMDNDEKRGLYNNMQVYTEDASGFDQFMEGYMQNMEGAVQNLNKTAISHNLLGGLLLPLYNAILDVPQESNFIDVWKSLDQDGKYALADIYMAVDEEERLGSNGFQVRNLVVKNAEAKEKGSYIWDEMVKDLKRNAEQGVENAKANAKKFVETGKQIDSQISNLANKITGGK